MTQLKAHFDGKVIVPDEPVDFALNQKLILHIEPVGNLNRPRGVTGKEFLDAIRKVKISREDLAAMKKAIEQDCERVDEDGW